MNLLFDSYEKYEPVIYGNMGKKKKRNKKLKS